MCRSHSHKHQGESKSKTGDLKDWFEEPKEGWYLDKGKMVEDEAGDPAGTAKRSGMGNPCPEVVF